MSPAVNKVAQCTETVDLTADEIRMCEEQPRPYYDVDPTLRCWLERGHSGPHASLGQTATPEGKGPRDAYDLWMHWGEGVRRLEVTDLCPLEETGDDDEACALPLDHPGAHEQEIHRQ